MSAGAPARSGHAASPVGYGREGPPRPWIRVRVAYARGFLLSLLPAIRDQRESPAGEIQPCAQPSAVLGIPLEGDLQAAPRGSGKPRRVVDVHFVPDAMTCDDHGNRAGLSEWRGRPGPWVWRFDTATGLVTIGVEGARDIRHPLTPVPEGHRNDGEANAESVARGNTRAGKTPLTMRCA